ncbi:hypothetical protein BV22DRAFT_1134592 [Leucogyrophana mollusca]|uniref:Uncharacterized protein n=1 Tax=Leucogyrophana mollusca TaxID=85980 RepID=A0ACB8AYU5_9AGAM|nr:hypothetical protein BV22DRAFT_1134592 [Leucogyrophana mollusca]
MSMMYTSRLHNQPRVQTALRPLGTTPPGDKNGFFTTAFSIDDVARIRNIERQPNVDTIFASSSAGSHRRSSPTLVFVFSGTQRPPNTTVQPPAPPSIATPQPASMLVIPAQPSFRGEEPADWVRQFQLGLPNTWTAAEKIVCFGLQCAAGSAGETWFNGLDAAQKATWEAFMLAFNVRWLPPVAVQLSVAQQRERLRAIILKEDDIGAMIEDEHRQDWGHVRWACQVSRLAQGFGDNNCQHLDAVLSTVPYILRDQLTEQYNTWADFLADVNRVPTAQLNRVKERAASDRALREEVERIKDQLQSASLQANVRQQASTPQLVNQAFAPVPTYRPLPRPPLPPNQFVQQTTIPMAQQPQAALPQPQMQAYPATPQTPVGQNPFTLGRTTPMSQANLFYSFRGGQYPQMPSPNSRVNATDRLRVAAQYSTLIHHPDTEAGRQAYNKQV